MGHIVKAIITAEQRVNDRDSNRNSGVQQQRSETRKDDIARDQPSGYKQQGKSGMREGGRSGN